MRKSITSIRLALPLIIECFAIGSLAFAQGTTPPQSNVGNVAGKVRGAPGKSVVYLESIEGKTFPAPTQHSVMNLKGLLFQPHILVVQVGSTVDFLNSDNVQHNVFWPAISGDKRVGHNLGTWPPGEKLSWKFDYPGVVPLLCNVHPEMAGYIVVAPTPFYAITDPDGTFVIQEIPYGRYSVWAWHEGTKPQSASVEVDAYHAPVTDFDFLAGNVNLTYPKEAATLRETESISSSVHLEEGQKPDEVERLLGKPDDITRVKGTLIYTYPTVKVFFENGKLVNVEERKK